MTDTAGLLDAERQLLGCVLMLPAGPAARLLTGLDPDDLTDPMCAWVSTLAAAVLGTGRPAGPVAVFDHAREHCDTTPRTGGAERLARLGVWLLDTYRDTPHASPEHAEWLKTVVLKQAWRRAVTAHATRVLQAAEQCCTTDLRRIHTDTTHTERLWRRYHTATHTRADTGPATRPATRRAA